MKLRGIMCIALTTTVAIPAAFAGVPSLAGKLPSGNTLHVMTPPTEKDAPSPEIWETIRKSELMMSITIFESRNKKVVDFHQKQPCQFERGSFLSCDSSSDSLLAGMRYEYSPQTGVYICKSGCNTFAPVELSVREPIVFDPDPAGGLLIDQHGP